MPPFDPNAAAAPGSGLFGLPFSEEESRLVIIPVPWDATTSYRPGTARGPAAIRDASAQIDLYDLDVERPYEPGLCMRPIDPAIEEMNARARADAERIIDVGGVLDGDADLEAALSRVNEAGAWLNARVHGEVASVLVAGRIAAVLGGDHAVPFGAFTAAAERFGEFGVLHFDAHSDTRAAYEGFTWSHASIMHNALSRIPAITRLVQVGIRDVCEQEIAFCGAEGDRVSMFTDGMLARRLFEGVTWHALARAVVDALPEKVWVSFDIDGLDPRFCPNTGTPVPGGLDFQQANHLLGEVVRSGRHIIGFDLNEVAPALDGDDEWDANVGARLLYKLVAWTFASQGLRRTL